MICMAWSLDSTAGLLCLGFGRWISYAIVED